MERNVNFKVFFTLQWNIYSHIYISMAKGSKLLPDKSSLNRIWKEYFTNTDTQMCKHEHYKRCCVAVSMVTYSRWDMLSSHISLDTSDSTGWTIPVYPKLQTVTLMSRSSILLLYCEGISVHVSTWRNCDSPHRLSTAFWQLCDSGVWIPLCSQTAPSIEETQSQRQCEDILPNSTNLEKYLTGETVCVHTYLSRSDLNVKVVPLVWNLEYFGPSKAIYPKSVFVDQESIGTHAEHDVHSLWVLWQIQMCVTYIHLINYLL